MNYNGQVKTSWSALFLKEIPDGPNDINFKISLRLVMRTGYCGEYFLIARPLTT